MSGDFGELNENDAFLLASWMWRMLVPPCQNLPELLDRTLLRQRELVAPSHAHAKNQEENVLDIARCYCDTG